MKLFHSEKKKKTNPITISSDSIELSHYYHVFNSVVQFIGILSVDGVLLDCNESSLSIIDKPKENIIGQYFWQTPWWDHTPELAAQLKASIFEAAKGETIRFEAVHIDISGNERFVDFSIKPVKDEAGNVQFLIPEGRDITEIKNAYDALYKSEFKYKELFEKSGDALLIIKGDQFVACNQATIDMLKFENMSAFFEAHPSELSPEFQADGQHSFEKAEKMMQLAVEKGTHRFEWTHRKADGTEFPVEVLLTSLGTDERYLYVVWRDITDRKKNEARVRNMNVLLEAQVHERTEELEQVQEKLIESSKLASLGELVAGISHEINTPIGIGVTTATYLNNMISLLHSDFEQGNLTKGMFKEVVEEVELATQAILKNLNRASDLINSFKEIAVDQSANLERTFNLASYLEELKSSLRNLLKYDNHELVLKIDDSINLYGNPGTFSQVFQNLIQNSIHHGFEGQKNGRITITANVKSDTLFMTYRDNGKGISHEHIEKVFNPFFTTGRSKGRTGLGMSIVHNHITELKGHIILNSNYKEGTEFTIEIPVGDMLR